MLEAVGSFLADQWFGVVGIILAVVVTRHFTARKRLRYLYSLHTLQTKNHPAVRIEYSGHEVETLHRARIAVWNGGNRAIKSSDMPAAGPPKIHIPPGGRILSIQIETSRDGIQIQMESQSDLSFDYLNPNDGVGIELLFDGPADATPDKLAITGSIIGGSISGRSKHEMLFGDVGMIVALLLVFVSLLAPPLLTYLATLSLLGSNTLAIIAGAFATGLSAFFLVPRVMHLTVLPGVPAWAAEFLGNRPPRTLKDLLASAPVESRS